MTEIVIFFAALFGLAVGSFLNVCIYRLPREGLTLSRPRRSFCPSCGSEIAWYDNLPVVSWIALGGKCRACRAPISPRYVVVEVLTGALFVIIAARYLTGDGASLAASIAVALLASGAIAASFIDLELQSIPDQITVRGMALAPLAFLAAPGLHPRIAGSVLSRIIEEAARRAGAAAAWAPDGLRTGWGLWMAAATGGVLLSALGFFGFAGYWRTVHRGDPRPLRDGWLSALLCAEVGALVSILALRPALAADPRVYALAVAFLGMLAGSALVRCVGVVGRLVFRKPAMGFGDVKLMGLLGAFTGPVGVVAGFFAACILGSIIGIGMWLRTKSSYIPFGPFLVAGCFLMILWPEGFDRALQWYLGFFQLHH